MKTVITRSAAEAAEFIRRGGIAAFPTETVYGLGADVFNQAAVRKIFEAKGRPADNPLIVHISQPERIDDLSSEVTASARKFVSAFFPGPLTVVLKKSERVPLIATAGLETIGVRMPRNPIAREFLAACSTPVAAPSANISGRPSSTTWQAVFEDLDGRIDCILKGEPTQIGLESTVVDCTGEVPVLLRAGAVSLEDLRHVVPETVADSSDPFRAARSPGLRHQHYRPAAAVRLIAPGDVVSDLEHAAYIGLHQSSETFVYAKVCSSIEEYAHELFEFFRECDRRAIQTIYCQKVTDVGIGRALMDRLRRAVSA